MPSLYKTPGVYVEEITKFPPSIAPVETAIPAFVGYTEKADKIKPDDLLNIPVKIGSLTEYEFYFGAGARLTVDEVVLDDSKNFKSAKISNEFFMYDSLRLFYANGGGDCYIVSTGTYDVAGKSATEFTADGKGISALEKFDEPTILVFPDNSLLDDYKDVCDAALAQCGSLQDRVGLFHVNKDDPQGTDFRSKTGIKDLKYGMVYSPWLEVNFPKNIKYRDFYDKIFIGTTPYNLVSLTDSDTIKALITGYETIMTDVDTIKAASTTLSTDANKSLRDRFNELEGTYLGSKSVANLIAILNYFYGFAREVDKLVGSGAGKVGDADLKSSFTDKLIPLTLFDIYSTLISYDLELKAKYSPTSAYTIQFNITPPTADKWGDIFTYSKYTIPPDDPDTNPVKASSVISGSDNTARMDSLLPLLRTLFDKINSAWLGSVASAALDLETKKHDGLVSAFPLYNTILAGLKSASTYVPPSGAVAGIFAYVDRTRGVWKAPANVSISGIIGPKDTFTASQLDALNVDVNSGKSVNAIRKFTGKGTLVYGARTLTGNDNEWRYVSVRRFFNFVEESTKKATEQFVFEPNDANTWVRIQAMIENFLTLLWRQGALQGIKPEHAFYVAVGLGKTMTPIDILEGRLIIEIGMAAVRPAEFIILKFSHKMAES